MRPDTDAEIALSRKMPAQKPGKSKQDYGTPREFIEAVERRFGELVLDLAARNDNKKCEYYISPDDDSLSCDWADLAEGDNCWLNPPFGNIAQWAEKCAAEGAKGCKIFFLVPASVGANWYWDHAHGQSLVLQIGRLSFDGSAGEVYPKDLMLCCYGQPAGFERWRWRNPLLAA